MQRPRVRPGGTTPADGQPKRGAWAGPSGQPGLPGPGDRFPAPQGWNACRPRCYSSVKTPAGTCTAERIARPGQADDADDEERTRCGGHALIGIDPEMREVRRQPLGEHLVPQPASTAARSAGYAESRPPFAATGGELSRSAPVRHDFDAAGQTLEIMQGE